MPRIFTPYDRRHFSAADLHCRFQFGSQRYNRQIDHFADKFGQAHNPEFRFACRQLFATLGGRAAKQLIEQLEFANDRFYVKLYQGDGPVDANGRKYMYPGLRNSPIVVGNLADLEYYQVRATHPDFSRGPEQLSYLKNYLLIPTLSGKMIFVGDTHNHALFGWALAREIGLTDKRAALVHVDAHRDENAPFYGGATVRMELGKLGRSYINHCERQNYLFYNPASRELTSQADALTLELFHKYHTEGQAEMNAVLELIQHRQAYDRERPRGDTLADYAAWSRSFADICSFIYPGEETLFQELFMVLTKENGQAIDRRQSDLHGQRVAARILSIERMEQQVRALKAEGRKVIFDLDLDYFAHYHQECPDSGPEAKQRVPFERNFQQVVELARQADFITVATSPDWFADQRGAAREILQMFVGALR